MRLCVKSFTKAPPFAVRDARRAAGNAAGGDESYYSTFPMVRKSRMLFPAGHKTRRMRKTAFNLAIGVL